MIRLNPPVEKISKACPFYCIFCPNLSAFFLIWQVSMSFPIQLTLSLIVLISFLFQSLSTSWAMEEVFTESSPNKPRDMGALVWLCMIEKKRDEAALNKSIRVYEGLTREISATLAGKYGFSSRLATDEERYIILESVIKTRAFYNDKLDIINDFYFGYDQPNCWQAVERDRGFASHIEGLQVI